MRSSEASLGKAEPGDLRLRARAWGNPRVLGGRCGRHRVREGEGPDVPPLGADGPGARAGRRLWDRQLMSIERRPRAKRSSTISYESLYLEHCANPSRLQLECLIRLPGRLEVIGAVAGALHLLMTDMIGSFDTMFDYFNTVHIVNEKGGDKERGPQLRQHYLSLEENHGHQLQQRKNMRSKTITKQPTPVFMLIASC